MKILVYPKSENPYQNLLYSQKEFMGKIAYLDSPKRLLDSLLIFIPIIRYRLSGYSIFHLHWMYPFAIINPLINTMYFFFFLGILRICNYKIVWTVHNVLPHEHTFLSDSFAMKLLSHIAHASIAHSQYTIDHMNEHKFSTKNTSIIPIGHYIDIYPNEVSAKTARKNLGIPEDNFVLLFFGIIRKYKGLDLFLQAMEDIWKTHPKVVVVIAGKTSHEYRNDTLREAQTTFPSNLIVNTDYIADTEVQYYMNASDAVILPFSSVTTSSTALLAMSFKKPIIYPQMGNLADISEDIGFSFEANNQASMVAAIKKSIQNSDTLASKGTNGYNYILKFTWDDIAKQTLALYQSLHH